MFTYLDVIFLTVGLLFAWFGLRTGIIVSIFYLASSFFGMGMTHAFSARLHWHPYLVFVLAAGLFILAGFLLRRFVKKMMLGPLDRLGGALLGLLLGAAVVALAFPLVRRSGARVQTAADASYTAGHILPAIHRAVPALAHFRLKGELERAREGLPLPKDLKLPAGLTLTATKK